MKDRMEKRNLYSNKVPALYRTYKGQSPVFFTFIQ